MTQPAPRILDHLTLHRSRPLDPPAALPGLLGVPRGGSARARRVVALADTASNQSGVVSHEQLRLAGWSAQDVQHELSQGRWQRLAPHVVALHNGPLTRRQRLWLGWLHAGRRAVLSHLTACVESGLEHWVEASIEVLVPKSSQIPRLDGVTFHETRRDYAGWVHPTARPRRLRLEPAALLAAERQRLAMTGVGLIASCVQQRRTTAERLFVSSLEIAKLRHGKVFRAALGDIAGGAHSFSEIEVGRLCRAAGLTPPMRQQIRVDKAGRRRYLDCEWVLPDGRIVVLEIDGGFHLESGHWWQDMVRERAIVLSGRVVLRCSSIEIRLRPEVIMADLRSIGIPPLHAGAS